MRRISSYIFFVSTFLVQLLAVSLQALSFDAHDFVPALAVSFLHFSMHLAFSAAVLPLQHSAVFALQQAGVAVTAFFSALTSVLVVVLVTVFV